MKYTRSLFILGCIVLMSCSNNVERGYYEDGGLEYEVQTKDGNWNGELKKYYPTGELYYKTNYLEGFMHGSCTIYFKNGSVKQIHEYKHGIKCCKSRFYRRDSSLAEIKYFNENGQFIDFKKFKKNGEKDGRITSKMAIFISESDTIYNGNSYNAEIRLGNRTYSYIDVFIGDPKDRMILHSDRLKKKDSITAILNIPPEELKVGINNITGVVFELNPKNKKEYNVIPFKHEVFVKEK